MPGRLGDIDLKLLHVFIAVAEGDFTYIRNEADGREELFNEREDPQELSNRAGLRDMKPLLEQFRKQVDRFRSGAGAPR